jgi:hypothetical protein
VYAFRVVTDPPNMDTRALLHVQGEIYCNCGISTKWAASRSMNLCRTTSYNRHLQSTVNTSPHPPTFSCSFFDFISQFFCIQVDYRRRNKYLQKKLDEQNSSMHRPIPIIHVLTIPLRIVPLFVDRSVV